MGMNDTPSGERVHIGFFGRRNAGKSSVVNAVTGQNLAIVSDTKGTTTDPVYKAMELLPLGPVLIIDTPGLDDTGALGELRVARTRQVLNKTDIAVLVIDAAEGMQQSDKETLDLIREKQLPYIIVYNKSDLTTVPNQIPDDVLYVSARNNTGIHELKERMARLKPQDTGVPIVRDMVHRGDFFVLVVPVDSAAPKGRLILPQQQTIRDILDADGTAIVVKETGLKDTLYRLGQKPQMVITDSQAFKRVSADTPDDITLTSFSILMARHKGFLDIAIEGVRALKQLQDGDTVLISEGCTHHRQCDDIGTVKIPRWLQQYTGKKLVIETSSGRDFPMDLTRYAMVIHCGGCMLNEREVAARMQRAQRQHVPITNYGIFIACIHGILKRSLAPFPDLQKRVP
ncbi:MULTISPECIES: [FeFe] hydrogenase H-cluster maturation GTPase HydF [unclassified Megasphaera]|uniref:[FeFe] hydrogenase H-cluster maturation GTPase HydF n=1 Tax=unclassified Megasphaera TaxID=2626256 RepID=UPI0025BEB612|nr:[FeFe] hydrogenase H-cluster maturation GTPase HydF [Megasphaera sp. UBA4233]